MPCGWNNAGIHLLLTRGAWRRVREDLQLVVALDVPAPTCRAQLVQRKVLGGRSEADAEAHFLRVDAPNIRQHQVLSPRTLSLFYIENTSVHRKGV